METNYSKAWSDFKKTKGYKKTIKVLEDYSITQPYADGILKTAFEAGWNATNTEIKFIRS